MRLALVWHCLRCRTIRSRLKGCTAGPRFYVAVPSAGRANRTLLAWTVVACGVMVEAVVVQDHADGGNCPRNCAIGILDCI